MVITHSQAKPYAKKNRINPNKAKQNSTNPDEIPVMALLRTFIFLEIVGDIAEITMSSMANRYKLESLKTLTRKIK
ncbi:hypothetical protein JCM19037_1261 [Geomicrobium sp. JCM 19037]|nr:hypothetical protein JCM19037_1261 [Geomicrobium sp. JCM 19037]